MWKTLFLFLLLSWHLQISKTIKRKLEKNQIEKPFKLYMYDLSQSEVSGKIF